MLLCCDRIAGMRLCKGMIIMGYINYENINMENEFDARGVVRLHSSASIKIINVKQGKMLI